MFAFVKKNMLYKVLSLNAFSVGVSLILGIFSTKIISVFLGPPGMAMMGGFRNFATMTKSLATLGVSNSIVKLFVVAKEDQKELSAIYSTYFWLFLSISIVLGILTFAFSSAISAFLFASAAYDLPVKIFALILPFSVLNTFWMAIYNGMQLFRKIILIQIISNVLVFGITALFIWKGNIDGGLLSIAVAEVAMVMVTFLFVRSNATYFKFDLQLLISKKHFSVIRQFSIMALLTAALAPLTLVLIRNEIVADYSLVVAGQWDGIIRLSGLYMVFFNTGLSLYYMPKLSALNTDGEFKNELKIYFKNLLPLFGVVMIFVYLLRGLIVDIAFTSDFNGIKSILIWQLAGDFIRITTLAFGFQILVKTMMKEYFLIEIVFNLAYFTLSFFLMKTLSVEGVVQAYFISNLICLILVLIIFRKLLLRKRT